ncbi:Hypothetical_protein [Hexamita inflata]|uniref:Hypothetical_protein n=1 Tax=Hexamita inflata TaxID=28002 RepID=A0ABP1GJK0_9EUKA
MYCIHKEIILKQHKLCTIYERNDKQYQETPIISRSCSQYKLQSEEDNQLLAVEVVNLLKLTNYSIKTVQYDIQYLQMHSDTLERNINKLTRRNNKLILKLKIQAQ